MGTLDRSPSSEYHRLKLDGDKALEDSNYSEARVHLESALGHLQTYFEQEKALIEGRLAQARQGLTDDFLKKAEAFREAGDEAQANEAYDCALEAAPDQISRDKARLAMGEASDADMPLSAHLRGLYEKTLSAPKDATLHYNFAIELALDGFLDAAAGQLEGTVDLTEDSPETQAIVLFRLGNVYSDLERFDEAQGCYERALEQGYDPADVHYRLGTISDWDGDYATAQEHYHASLEANPEHVASLSAMGTNLAHQEQYEEALGYYQRLNEVDPEDEENVFKIASILMTLGASEDAASAFERVIELDPEGEYAEDAQEALDQLRS